MPNTDTTSTEHEAGTDEDQTGHETEHETTDTAGHEADDQTDDTAGDETNDDAETFPRAVVERLRRESAEHRTRARDRDDLAHRLHGALVTATGRLADPSDLPFDEGHLTDPDALAEAVDELLTRKPHLAARVPRGDIAQGPQSGDEAVDLAGIMRGLAS